MTRNRFSLLFMLFALLFSNFIAFSGNFTDGVHRLAQRQIGKCADSIRFIPINDKDGKDCYAIAAQNGKLEIKGSSPVAMAYGLRTYMQQACHLMPTWSGMHAGQPIHFPDYELAGESPYRYRYYLNVCTFGYTAPYWDWQRWEKEID